MRARRLRPVIARVHCAVTDTVHLANVWLGGAINRTNPVLPALPLHCEHTAYMAGRDWLHTALRALYAIF
jgi:hypothetical protein